MTPEEALLEEQRRRKEQEGQVSGGTERDPYGDFYDPAKQEAVYGDPNVRHRPAPMAGTPSGSLTLGQQSYSRALRDLNRGSAYVPGSAGFDYEAENFDQQQARLGSLYETPLYADRMRATSGATAQKQGLEGLRSPDQATQDAWGRTLGSRAGLQGTIDPLQGQSADVLARYEQALQRGGLDQMAGQMQGIAGNLQGTPAEVADLYGQARDRLRLDSLADRVAQQGNLMNMSPGEVQALYGRAGDRSALDQLAGQIAGGPLASQQQYQQSLDDLRGSLASMAATGPLNPAAAIAASKAASGMGQKLAAGAAQARASEVLGRQQAAAGILGQQRGMDIGLAGQRAGDLLARQQAASQAQLGALGQLGQLRGQDIGLAGQRSGEITQRQLGAAQTLDSALGQLAGLRGQDLGAAGALAEDLTRRQLGAGQLAGQMYGQDISAAGTLGQQDLARDQALMGALTDIRGQDLQQLAQSQDMAKAMETLRAQYEQMGLGEKQFSQQQQEEYQRLLADLAQRERDRSAGLSTQEAAIQGQQGSAVGGAIGTGAGLLMGLLSLMSDRRAKQGIKAGEQELRGLLEDVADSPLPFVGTMGQALAAPPQQAQAPALATPRAEPLTAPLTAPAIGLMPEPPKPKAPKPKAPQKDWGQAMQLAGLLAGGLGGMGRELGYAFGVSDERAKKGAKPDAQALRSLLDAARPYSYEYRPGMGPPGQRLGVMAQDLEQGGPLGRQMVQRDPMTGLRMVDVSPQTTTPVVLGALGDIHKRLKKLED